MLILRQVLRTRIAITTLLRQTLLFLLRFLRDCIFWAKKCQRTCISFFTESTPTTVLVKFAWGGFSTWLGHHLGNEAFDANLRIDLPITHQILTPIVRGQITAKIAASKIRLNIKVSPIVHAALIIACLWELSGRRLARSRDSLATLGSLLGHSILAALLDGHALDLLHISHFVEHVGGFTDFATEEHQCALVEVSDRAVLGLRTDHFTACGRISGPRSLLLRMISLTWLREVALLWALKTERVGDANVSIAEKPRTVLFVARVLEATRLESKHLGQHHAYELW